MVFIEADEAQWLVIGVYCNPQLDGREVQVAQLWQQCVDVGGLQEVVRRANGAQPDVEQLRVVCSDALANDHGSS
jgi:hypothetical protein